MQKHTALLLLAALLTAFCLLISGCAAKTEQEPAPTGAAPASDGPVPETDAPTPETDAPGTYETEDDPVDAPESTGGDTAALPAQTSAPDAPLSLRIGSYNIKNGADVDHNFAVLAQDIKAQNLDICGLQEVDQNTTRNGKKDTMALLSAASGLPYTAFCKAIDYKGGEYGTGILSRYPIVSFEIVKLDSDTHEQRAYGHAVLDVNGKLVDFYNTHLSYEEKATRSKQFAALAKELKDKTCWALTADFNTEDFSEFSVIADAQLVNNAGNRLISFNGKSAIDSIVLPSSASVTASGVLDSVSHSDHCMIWADVTMP